jgi:choline dehydrogenase
MQDHNAAGTAYPTLTNITGRTVLAALPTAADVLGANLSAIAASTLANLPLWAQQASNYTNNAVSAKAFLRRFTVQHDLIFRKNVTIAELFPTNDVTVIIPQLWVTMPFSWGSVHLGNVSNIDEPVIDSGLLRFEIDYQLLTGATKLSRRAYHSAPLTDIVGPEAVPGDSVLPVEADDAAYWAYLKENCESSPAP